MTPHLSPVPANGPPRRAVPPAAAPIGGTRPAPPPASATMPPAVAAALLAHARSVEMFCRATLRRIAKGAAPGVPAATLDRWIVAFVQDARAAGHLGRVGHGWHWLPATMERRAIAASVRAAALDRPSPAVQDLVVRVLAALPADEAEGACRAACACVHILANVAGAVGEPRLISLVAAAAVQRLLAGRP